MNWSKTTIRVRNVSPMIPTTRMTAESSTGNWSIHGLGPYWYELSTVGVGGREMFGKWVSLLLMITAPARLACRRVRTDVDVSEGSGVLTLRGKVYRNIDPVVPTSFDRVTGGEQTTQLEVWG